MLESVVVKVCSSKCVILQYCSICVLSRGYGSVRGGDVGSVRGGGGGGGGYWLF